MTLLVPPARPHDHDLEGLRSRLSEVEAVYGERSAAAARAEAALAAFKIRYRQEVGLLHDELDRLELALAEAELGELSKRVTAPDEPGAEPTGPRPEPQPRFTTDAVRRLFRDVAKAIHPDLAYALGDEEQLRGILQAWERSPEAIQGTGPEAGRLRLERRIAQIEEQLEMLASDQASLKDSPMWQLKAMVDEEAAKGKDLVKDMVRRLKRDILVATNRLDAMQPPR